MDNFSKMVEGVKITIEKMKKTPAELPWYMSVEQLEMTLKELDNMNRIRDMRQFMPYYPRGIADSWEFGVITWLPMSASPEYEEQCRKENIG